MNDNIWRKCWIYYNNEFKNVYIKSELVDSNFFGDLKCEIYELDKITLIRNWWYDFDGFFGDFSADSKEELYDILTKKLKSSIEDSISLTASLKTDLKTIEESYKRLSEVS